MKTQINCGQSAIEIQFSDKTKGNRVYGYSLLAKVSPTVIEKIHAVIDGIDNNYSFSQGKCGYAPCAVEFINGDNPHYNVVIENGEKRVKLGFNAPFYFDMWYKYAMGIIEKQCPICGKNYHIVVKGATICDCVSNHNRCASCGSYKAQGDYSYCGDRYCESCYFEIFTSCDVCNSVTYYCSSVYHGDVTYCEHCAREYLFKCSSCHETCRHDKYTYEYKGDYYCGDCYIDNFVRCHKCEESIYKYDVNDVYGHCSEYYYQSLCRSCYETANECKNCHNKITDDSDFCCERCAIKGG